MKSSSLTWFLAKSSNQFNAQHQHQHIGRPTQRSHPAHWPTFTPDRRWTLKPSSYRRTSITTMHHKAQQISDLKLRFWVHRNSKLAPALNHTAGVGTFFLWFLGFAHYYGTDHGGQRASLCLEGRYRALVGKWPRTLGFCGESEKGDKELARKEERASKEKWLPLWWFLGWWNGLIPFFSELTFIRFRLFRTGDDQSGWKL